MDKLVIATIQGDRMPEHYFFELLTCTNPLCACKNFVICFTQISDETGTTAMPLVEHRVAMDVSTLQPPKMSAHTASRFEKQFLTQLTRDDMNALHWWHNKLKSKAIENAVLSTLKAEFPLADIDKGITVAYMDVLPFVEHYNIMLANTSYELIDSYCVRSECACTTVNFNFLHIDPVKSTGNILTIYLADYRRPRALDGRSSVSYQ